MRKPRSQRARTGTGVCTRCGRKHPKGKKQRKKAIDMGWKCKPKIKKVTESVVSRFPDMDKHKAKCAATKLRNAERKAERIAKAQERKDAWNRLSVDEKLAELDKRPGNCTKQRAKIEEQLQPVV